jgi:hypothetical protein
VPWPEKILETIFLTEEKRPPGTRNFREKQSFQDLLSAVATAVSEDAREDARDTGPSLERRRHDPSPRALVGDDPDPAETHTRVRTGLIPIDGGDRRRQA